MVINLDDKKAVPKKRKKVIMPIIACSFLLGFVYMVYDNMQAYRTYGYCVVVEKVESFSKLSLPQDVEFNGRIPITECNKRDNAIDNGDGPKKGNVRWYNCTGPDCDEGWREGFKD